MPESTVEEPEQVREVQEDMGVDGEPVKEFLVLCEHSMLTWVRAQDSQEAVEMFAHQAAKCLPVGIWSRSSLIYPTNSWDTFKNVALEPIVQN